MKRVFILRTVAETSMPYIVNQTLEEFGESIQIFIITREENSEIMSRIAGITGVYLVDSLYFHNKSIITNLNAISDDVVILPVTNLLKVQSYNNVLKFIKCVFKKNEIYLCSFDDSRLVRFKNKNISGKIIQFFYLSVSYFFAVIFFLFFIFFFIFKISFFKKSRGEYLHGA